MSALKNPVIVPNLPPIQQELVEWIDTPVGKKPQMHPTWHAYFSQLNTMLSLKLSPEGLLPPQQSAVNISNLDPSNPNTFGAQIYDSTNHKVKININGTFETITTT